MEEGIERYMDGWEGESFSGIKEEWVSNHLR